MYIVSILVMMDLSFWHVNLAEFVLCKYRFQSLLWWICLFDTVSVNNHCTFRLVSILVMMDLSFWLKDGIGVHLQGVGFNPCYDGFVFLTRLLHSLQILRLLSFNPCYDGFVFLTKSDILISVAHNLVSILVMMDLSFWLVFT